ncbi:MAG: hypothetical protein JSV21_04260 [Nitrospirota bacterium]|nr:MAG: hypothetical protein JSV21_04260 [Nitrospirota bacterium]
MNRFDKKIIVFTFIAIISFWLVDTFVDYIFHYNETFSEIMLGSPKEIAFRSLFSICFLIFGIYLSKVVRDLKNSQGTIGKERLQSEEQRIKFESMLSAIGDGISIQDPDFKVLYQNDKHKEMVKGDKKGLYCYEEYANSDKVCDDCPVEKSFKDGLSASRLWFNPFWINTVSIVTTAIRAQTRARLY